MLRAVLRQHGLAEVRAQLPLRGLRVRPDQAKPIDTLRRVGREHRHVERSAFEDRALTPNRSGELDLVPHLQPRYLQVRRQRSVQHGIFQLVLSLDDLEFCRLQDIYDLATPKDLQLIDGEIVGARIPCVGNVADR